MCSRTYNVDYLVLLFLFCPLLLASNTLYKRTKTTKKKDKDPPRSTGVSYCWGHSKLYCFSLFVCIHACLRQKQRAARGLHGRGNVACFLFFFFAPFSFFDEDKQARRRGAAMARWKRSSDGSAQTCIAEGNPLSTRRRCRRRGASQSMPSTQANEPKGNKPKNTRLR